MFWLRKISTNTTIADTELKRTMGLASAASATQVRLAEVGPGEHGGIELSAAHVCFTQAGALQHCVGHQCELHIGLGEAGALETGRNEVRPT